MSEELTAQEIKNVVSVIEAEAKQTRAQMYILKAEAKRERKALKRLRDEKTRTSGIKLVKRKIETPAMYW